MTFDEPIVEAMLRDYFRPRRIALRGCQPRDLVNQALAMAEYAGLERRLTSALLEAACSSYFVDDAETGAPRARVMIHEGLVAAMSGRGSGRTVDMR